ncbi:LLM class flavin-dependent oxidoreductase [Actinospica durhamensis]|uniref:LLM class flavin-dependent oxidoreductase n=1 Tax=Actinospica durhamensis TaxID=1508375 RepID=A0A941IND5_9ACTN|nr:LLM class flavin-dependent oxidoreductase [Actinospica durhamensis]MBR7833849.1 LLM class flavin-dependent oxidoreductase [Actinospica durhamensis]
MTQQQIHLAVALDGAGWHQAAWREPDAVAAAELFGAAYWLDQVRRAEEAALDFVTFEDGLPLQPDGQVRGRLDASLIAARVAPLTSHVGLVPTITTTHTEPFHVSKVLATLDYASTGRAGWRPRLGALGEVGLPGAPRDEAPLFGRRTPVPYVELFAEAADHVEVVRRLWDSWEDDAEIRDAATGRFVDREKLHYIDFTGPHFSVRGPSITPRPPQGQPPVIALAHQSDAYTFAARSADVVLVTPQSTGGIAPIVQEIRTAQAAAGRAEQPLLVFGEFVVFLDEDPKAAIARKERLDETAGEAFRSDAPVFVGSPDELAEQLELWAQYGLDGFRLRPAAVPHDLDAITTRLVPRLRELGLFRQAYTADTLRGHLGLERPANRYAAVAAA